MSTPVRDERSRTAHMPLTRLTHFWSHNQTMLTTLRLPATPETCFWGHFDPTIPAAPTVDPGSEIHIEAVTHHSGDAPDLLIDDGIRAIWNGIAEADREPGVHIMTGPIHLNGAEPGDRLVVEILSTRPRLRHGSNCAANWELLDDRFGKERITVYELADAGAFGDTARPLFGFDFTARSLYDLPGAISEPDPATRQPFGREVSIPVRPHLGIMGVAPPGDERRSSIPPGIWGGNVDNWRFGPGTVVSYPVFHTGAGFDIGDPHFAQGDGEICVTAIEASLDVTVRLGLEKDTPSALPCSTPAPTGTPTGSGTISTRRCAWPPSRCSTCLPAPMGSAPTRPTRSRRSRSTWASPRSSTAPWGATRRSRSTCSTDHIMRGDP
ncbi:MAG: acetamidase/formamidase family protein [Acidimicrobiia bacterium]|nr:acetamidase/formamidase family protein [Acidimicrobiia bacterium]